MRRDPARVRRELEHLCGIVARAGQAVRDAHAQLRGRPDGCGSREQISLARATGCRLQISHLQAAGRANWDLQRRRSTKSRRLGTEGVDVEFDIYPYQCGSTVLTQWLPHWALDGGKEALLARLRDADTRVRIGREMDEARDPGVERHHDFRCRQRAESQLWSAKPSPNLRNVRGRNPWRPLSIC